MITENHWKHLKHGYLWFKVQSPLDQTIDIIAHFTIDSYIHSAYILEPEWCLSRGHPLTTWQCAFKTAWIELSKQCISGRNYNTNVTDWTCCCGTQDAHTFHLCKLLVHPAGNPAMASW